MKNHEIITYSVDLEVKSLEDLQRLSNYLGSVNMKPNYSELARRLGCDRRTVKKYYEEGPPSNKRNRSSILDQYHECISNQILVESSPKIFYTKASLYRKLKRDFNLQCSESTFRRYISKVPEFQEYFDSLSSSKKPKTPTIRYETEPGEQAQLDWKENIKYKLSNGETIKVNILVMLLSYSRLKLYALTTSRVQDILISTMLKFFEIIGGVPRKILIDNQTAIMKTPRTAKSPGEVNPKFKQFADDMGFEVSPCMANRPQTKGKVEACMKLLDDIHTYQGELNYEELEELTEKLNREANMNINQTTKQVPYALFEKEKETLLPLPRKAIRSLYTIHQGMLKASKDGLVTYKGKKYSVPIQYINTQLHYSVYDGNIHLYDNTKLICCHEISEGKINYHKNHYKEYLSGILPKHTNIDQVAHENLKKLGGLNDRDK